MFKRDKVNLAAMAALGLCCAAPAFAQTPVQRVEITGSNIKRIDLETAAPVQIINREAVKNSGAASVRELLQILPSSSVGSLSDINGSNSFASGASSADLRNLGKTSTLILLNGRRVAPYALADFNELFTNLDGLPLDAVERVEILRSGASAIYGSDAVAGVINIITRKDYQGLQVSAGHEQSQVSGRFKQSTASITGGFGDLERDRFNVLANLEVFKRESMMWRDVMKYINPLRLSSGGVPSTFNAQLSTFSYPGNLLPADEEIAPGPITGATAQCPANLVVDSLCRYDRFTRFQALPEAERTNLLLSGRMLFGGGLEGFGEVLYSKTKTKYLSPFQTYGAASGPSFWGNPSTNEALTFTPRGLPIGHPLNPFAEDDVELRYRFVDTPSENTTTSDNYRVLAGLKGVWNSYDWETSVGFLGSKVQDDQRGRFSNSGFIELIGDYRNLDPEVPLPTDFFNKPGGYRIGEKNSAAVIDRLFPNFGNAAKTTQTVLDGKLTGELGQMAGGPIGFATGVDLRHEIFTITPTENLNVGDIVGVGVSRTKGSRNFWAAFGELSLPVTKGVEMQVAARVDKFPNLAANLSPKVGLMWRANDALLLRGTLETGFRAPNLTETAPSLKASFENGTVDPKRCDQAVTLAEDLRAAADALPDSDPQKALSIARADIVEGNECQASVAGVSANNPKLKPEKSKSFTVGFSAQPLRNLNITVDYWNIQRKQEIDIKTAEELLAVEDSGLPPGSSIVRAIRDANDQSFTTAEQAQYGVTAGALTVIQRSFENLFQTRTSGVDVGVAWADSTPIGKLSIEGLATYLIKYREFVGSENRFGDNLASRYQYPRVNATADFRLASGDWVNGFKLRYSSGTELRRDFNDTEGDAAWCAARPWARPCEVFSSTFVDYYVRWSGVKDLTLGLYIKNIANRFIPIDYRAQPRGSVIPDEPDDAKRRAWRFTAEYKFW
jgi:iron complex outermembrane recepter protein